MAVGVVSEASLPTWLVPAGFWAAAIGLFAVVVRQIGPWRKQISDLETTLRAELVASNVRCEAELRLIRHRERGSRTMIYSLLHLFDMPAEKRVLVLDGIRSQLGAMEQAEATETGIVVSAGIGGVKP